MSDVQSLPQVVNPNPVHPNAKTTTQINNGTTTTKTNITSPVCRNCKTQTTPLWRRDETGQVLCNACGLFLKLHGRPRPISLKTDTIKSRNRIKQPNFSKSSGPNTPELKSRDSKVHIQSAAKKSPKSAGTKRKQGSEYATETPPYPALLSASNSATSTAVQSPLQHPTRAPYGSGNYVPQMGLFPAHNQVQSLHYPSSTPTQFAPGLQRITSPLLLSTNPSVSNARSSNSVTKLAPPQGSLSVAAAAGALENMSNEHMDHGSTDQSANESMSNDSNELGPSATFRGSAGSAPVSSAGSGVSLMQSSGPKPDSSSFSTPSTALKAQTHPPTLPALGATESRPMSGISSPSFGPQFHLSDVKQESNPSKVASPDIPSSAASALPPIQHLPGRLASGPLPSVHSTVGSGPSSSVPSPPQHSISSIAQHPGAPSSGAQLPRGNSGSPAEESGSSRKHEKGHSSKRGSGHSGPDGSSGNGGNGGNGNGAQGNASFEVAALKTRISELELVNDLYRTRILELEAMEQAARLRENSMRRRLDDLLREQGHTSSSYMLSNTMKVLKREDDDSDYSKRQKTSSQGGSS